MDHPNKPPRWIIGLVALAALLVIYSPALHRILSDIRGSDRYLSVFLVLTFLPIVGSVVLGVLVVLVIVLTDRSRK